MGCLNSKTIENPIHKAQSVYFNDVKFTKKDKKLLNKLNKKKEEKIPLISNEKIYSV